MFVTHSPFESNYTVLFNNALSRPSLAARCCELTKLIEESNTKILDQTFVHLISTIFGVGHPGWSLPTITLLNHTADYAVLKDFLGPRGPLFKMIERLQLEGGCRYDLPSCIAELYTSADSQDASASLSAIGSKFGYVGKQSFVAGSLKNQVTKMQAFEYFFHHFAFCIMNVSQLQNPYFRLNENIKMTACASVLPEENLYYDLQNDYLLFFLPTDGSYPPTMNAPTMNAHVHAPLQNVSTSATFMLKKMVPKPSTGGSISYQEIWRSEVLIQTLVEVWMCQEKNKHQITLSEPLVRVVRRLVKHFHHFVNSHSSIVAQMNISDSVMEQFSHSQSVYLQPKLLGFLVHCFEAWPLDCSFRIVLETWLSYIQPWRYTNSSRNEINDFMRLSSDKDIANIWYQFISNNLAFYSKLFYLSVTRFLRMDLSLHLNSLLLYRVAKIFSQSNLLCMIDEAEQSPYGSENTLYNMHAHNAASFMSVVRQPANSGDTSMQHNMNGKEIHDLIHQLVRVCKQALGTIRKQLKHQGKDWNSWLVKLFSAVGVTPPGPTPINHLLSVDSKKSEQHLIDSIRLFSSMFNVELEPALEQEKEAALALSKTGGYDESLYDAHGELNLTDAARFDLRNNVKKVAVIPNCDPALQPIRSFECGPLVRLMHRCSSLVNKHHEKTFEALCARQGFVGAFSKHLLVPTYNIKGVSPLNIKAKGNLAPRVSFRFMAHYRTLFYLFVYGLIATLSGYEIFSQIFILALLFVLYLTLEVLYATFTKKDL